MGRKGKNCSIYDVIEKETIYITNIEQKAKELNLGYSVLNCICNNSKHINKYGKEIIDSRHIKGRFIHPDNKNLIITLVDLDSQKEYECISSQSLAIHLNISH